MKNIWWPLLAVAAFIPRQTVAQQVRMVKWDEFAALTSSAGDTTLVINFWATWCKPCVQELPYFNHLAEQFPGRKLKVILVSLDFKRQFETSLVPFVNKNKIIPQVLLLDEPDYNSWIDKVDSTWSGAIPATLIMNKALGIHTFHEAEFTAESLTQTVKPLIP